MKYARIIAGLPLVFAAAAAADVVVDATNTKRDVVYKNAKISGVADGKVVFVGETGREQKLDLALVRRIELSVNTEKELNAAENLYAEGDGKWPDAAKKYEALAAATGGPQWRPRFVRGRMVLIYAKLGDAEAFAKHFVELFRMNAADAGAIAPNDVPRGNEKAIKTVRDAVIVVQKTGQNTETLRKVLAKMGGDDTTTVAKVDPGATTKTGPNTTTDPVTKVGPTPAGVDPVSELRVATSGNIDEIAGMRTKGQNIQAADLFLKVELGVDTKNSDAEQFLLAGGMACIEAAKILQSDIDKLKAESFQKMGEERSKLQAKYQALEPQRIRLLTNGAIALTEALTLPGSDDKRFAEAAYWCAWAHEQLNRPLRARVLYDHFVGTFEKSAPAELVTLGKAAVQRLGQGG